MLDLPAGAAIAAPRTLTAVDQRQEGIAMAATDVWHLQGYRASFPPVGTTLELGTRSTYTPLGSML